MFVVLMIVPEIDHELTVLAGISCDKIRLRKHFLSQNNL